MPEVQFNLRYVVLRHEGIPDPHFDLMLETAPGSKLATWRAPVWPIDGPVEIVLIGDHRREYLDYEGPLSENRGHVRRVDAGTCRVGSEGPVGQTFQLESARGETVRLELASYGRWIVSPS
ncbi:MAG: hypothetical protein ACREJC_00300 [Tepidisphaeraceae bacterium]